MDAPEYNTMWELAELARKNDKESRRLNTNMIASDSPVSTARVTRSGSRTYALRTSLREGLSWNLLG